jgi:hypothetical protein
MLVAFAVTSLVGSLVFKGLSQFLLFSAYDKVNQDLRGDMLLSMDQLCKDINLCTNVIPKAGGLLTDNTTLALRRPKVDADGNIQAGAFEYVTYTVKTGSSTSGMVRQVWAQTTDQTPVETVVLNDSIVALGMLFGGKPIGQVTNLTVIRDIEIILVAGRKTGLKLTSANSLSTTAFTDLTVLTPMLDQGIEFESLRDYIDQMNSDKVDIALSATMGAATFRNQRALGLKTTDPPVTE